MQSTRFLTPEQARRLLAGLENPDRKLGESVKAEVREAVIRLGSVLARLYSDSLDRTQIWGRIGSALTTSGAKVSDGDIDRFVSLCLEHIDADPVQAAACDALTQILQTAAVRPQEWRQEFIHYIMTHHFAVVTHSRARWEEVKSGRATL